MSLRTNTGMLSEALRHIASRLQGPNNGPNLAIIALNEAADRLIEMQAELISCHRKLSEIERLEYPDMDHGSEIK